MSDHPRGAGGGVRQQRSERIFPLEDRATFPAAPEREPRRGPLALLIAPIAALIACGYVADALWPTLVESHPLWLLGLSARNRYAVMVVNRVDLWAYYLWGTLRLLLPDPFFFALGWFYGPAALRWMERRTPSVGSMMRRLEGWFARRGHALVLIMPNNYVCLIAGAAQMSPVVFALLNVTGTVGRLALLQIVGDIFDGPINWFLDLVAQYRIPLLVVSILVVAVMAGGELRRGRKEIEGLQELDHSTDPDAPPVPNRPFDPTDRGGRSAQTAPSDAPGPDEARAAETRRSEPIETEARPVEDDR
jgi:membrane protein DedA with SNARE-associated domain